MTDEIEPALTAEEWRNEGMDDPPILGDIRYVEGASYLAKIVALANSMLPDDDPRKITRERIGMIRSAGDSPRAAYAAAEDLAAFADALESYLPPETP